MSGPLLRVAGGVQSLAPRPPRCGAAPSASTARGGRLRTPIETQQLEPPAASTGEHRRPHSCASGLAPPGRGWSRWCYTGWERGGCPAQV